MQYKGIGISGVNRSGKDTLCAALVASSNLYERVAFADELKKLATELSGINMFAEKNKTKHRGFLIQLGQAMRALNPLYWVEAATPKLKETAELYKRIPVVTDLRFKNEADALRKMGFLLVRLECSQEALMARGHNPDFANDPSEAELNDYPHFHLTLRSDTLTPEQLADEVRLFAGV